MTEPKLEPNDKEQQPVLAEGPWNDKVLVDAIGYTRGLVSILDSLTDGFQRRGREIEEQRHRLATLQSERRAILEGRAELEARISTHTAERDGLRATLEGRDRELERLRQEVAQGQIALDARLREIQEFQAGMAESARQAEELREIVRDLQRERESLTHRQAILEAKLEEEQRQARETAARATQAQAALREDLRSGEAAVAGLTAERDGLRATLEGRDRELERLRQEVAQGQIALDARLREIQEFQAGMAESARQAEELREIVRDLQRERESLTHRQAILEAKLEEEQRQARETAARATQAQAALREDLRSGEAAVAGLTAERDGLRATLEGRDRELERLRQEVAQGQIALDARLREIQEFQAGMAESARQAEELREIVRDLQRERESLTHRQAILEAKLEEEQRQARETAARATQAQAALREDLTDAENILAGLRKDIASAQGLIASLRRTAEEEHSRTGLLQEQLRFQTMEVARLTAAIQGAQALLGELDDALGGDLRASRPEWEPSAQRREWSALAEFVEGPESAANLGREALAMLHPIVEGLRSVLGPADGAAIQLPRSAADQAAVRQRAQQIADRWRQLLRERADSAQRERQLREENERLVAELAATKGGRDARREDQRSTPTRNRRVPAGETIAPHGAGENTLRRGAGGNEAAAPAAPAEPQRAPKRRTALSGMTVECTLETSGGEAPCVLRGQIVSINTMGLMGAFEEQFPEDGRVAVRFVRGGEEFMFPGRILRVQRSATTPDAPPVFHHLIRFESPAAKPDA